MDDQRKEPMHTPQPPARPITMGRAAELAGALAEGNLGAALLRRFDISGAPGVRAAQLGGVYRLEPMRAAPLELTVSPYAPPQRQISVVRQGAPMWPPAGGPPPPLPAMSAPQRPAAPGGEGMPDDIRRLLDLHRSLGRI
jgi:hypothetical protein